MLTIKSMPRCIDGWEIMEAVLEYTPDPVRIVATVVPSVPQFAQPVAAKINPSDVQEFINQWSKE